MAQYYYGGHFGLLGYGFFRGFTHVDVYSMKIVVPRLVYSSFASAYTHSAVLVQLTSTYELLFTLSNVLLWSRSTGMKFLRGP